MKIQNLVEFIEVSHSDGEVAITISDEVDPSNVRQFNMTAEAARELAQELLEAAETAEA